MQENAEKTINRDEIEMITTNVLLKLGIPANIRGYSYIREALVCCIVSPKKTVFITKDLYPEIAVKFKTTPQRVERAIRHAIEKCWTLRDSTVLEDYFYLSDRKRPTNSEFIAVIADKIRFRIEFFK